MPPPPRHCRLVHVAKQQGWDTEHHRFWPDDFKAAMRTLLLCSHRLARGAEAGGRAGRAERAARRAGGGQGGATLGSLPLDLLLQVAQRAAFPVSGWM